MFYISYLALFSIFIIVLLGVIDIINKRKLGWFVYSVLFFIVCIINFLCIYHDFWSAFHYGDEEYFYSSALHIIEVVKGGATLNEALINYTWNYKYYGFIVFDALSILGATNSPEAHKFSITIVLSCVYIYFIRFCFIKKYIDNISLSIIVFPMMIYLSVLNYRDGLISIVCFLLLLSILNKKILMLVVNVILLFFLRVEFIFIIFLAVLFSLVVSFFKRSPFLNLSSILFLLLLLILLNNKEGFDDSNFFLLPLSFNGVSIIQEFFLYISGEHYYQGVAVVFLLGILVSLPLFILKTFFMYYFVFGFYVDSYKKKFLVNFVIGFFFISMFIYNFMLDGMQDRIKLSFTFLLAFMFNIVYRDVINDNRFRCVLFLSFMMSAVIAVRNVRWIY